MTEKWKIVFRFLKYILITVFIFSFLSYLALKWAGSNTNHFRIDNDYDITLKSSQCMTCFMDWDIDFDIEITDLKSKKTNNFTFHSPGGPQFIFATSDTKKILVSGYDQCSGLNWIINLNKNTISDYSVKVNFEEYTEKCKLTTKFEIEELKNKD